MDCSGFYLCTLALIETFTATSVIRQRMRWTFISSWRSLSFKSRPHWCHCRDDRTEILSFCIRCCRRLSRCRGPDALRPAPLTCGDFRRHPGEPPALTFHYIFHYISHPFSWWQLAPWLLRRGDALRRAHLISSHTRTGTHLYVCAHTVTRTNTHWMHSCLRWLTPDYRFLFTSRKVTGQAGGQQGGYDSYDTPFWSAVI